MMETENISKRDKKILDKKGMSIEFVDRTNRQTIGIAITLKKGAISVFFLKKKSITFQEV